MLNHSHLVTESKEVAAEFVARYAEAADGHTTHIAFSRNGSEYSVLVSGCRTDDETDDETQDGTGATLNMAVIADLVTRYAELVGAHGVGSDPAEAFIQQAHEAVGFAEFLQLAPVVNRLHRVCSGRAA